MHSPVFFAVDVKNHVRTICADYQRFSQSPYSLNPLSVFFNEKAVTPVLKISYLVPKNFTSL